ncbi:MAG: tetratricopeptide repeat protein [Coriobacteriia bacterium]|nr:tetratricopeptide repeat protein [Coriobacteriia bacterium]
MLNAESMLRQQIDELEEQGKYYEMIKPLNELVELLSVRCASGGCSTSKETPEYAVALDRLGGLYRNTGNLERSEEVYKQAVQTSATVFGTNDPNYATTLNNYAGLQRLRKNFDGAEDAYKRAEGIYNATLGPNHVLTVSCLNNRGLLRQDQSRLDEALELHTEALRRLNAEPGNEVAKATTLNNLGSVYAKMGKYEEAKDHIEQASKIYQETVGEASDLYLGQIHNLASIQALGGDFEGAKEHFEWVLDRVRDMFGPRSDNLVSVLNNLISVYEQLGLDDKAQSAREELKEIKN